MESILALLNSEQLPVLFVGPSKGTISAAYLATASLPLQQGLILTSTVSKNQTFTSINLAEVISPILFIHHRFDECLSSPFDITKKLWLDLPNSVFAEFLSFHGGHSISEDPCKARTHHGFWGVDQDVVTDVADWIDDLL